MLQRKREHMLYSGAPAIRHGTQLTEAILLSFLMDGQINLISQTYWCIVVRLC